MAVATFVTPETSRPQKTNRPGLGTHFYFGRYHEASPGPQAFRVHFQPHAGSQAHFHHVDQFQLFFGAPDTVFQRHETGPLLLHYADADTLYGPFAAGEEPFSFLTLRRSGSDFQGHMPEHREQMLHGGTKRHFAEDLRFWQDEPIPSSGGPVEETVIEGQGDQLSAVRIMLPAGASFVGPRATDSGGQYYVIVEGEALFADEVLTSGTIGWVGANDDPPQLTGGAVGAKLLVCQFGKSNAVPLGEN